MGKYELNSIGTLKTHPDISDEWLQSEPISIPFFDGKKLNFNFDGFEGDKEFFDESDKAISIFLEKDKQDRLALSNLIFKNYADAYEAFGEDENIPKIEDEKDIWKYVYPQAIYVSRRDRCDKDIYIQIHCECKWESEHGLQIVFRQGKKVTRVSSIDGHLTESDACDTSDADDELLSKF